MIKTKGKKNKILTLEDVSISYGNFQAVKNVFCDFKEGNITWLYWAVLAKPEKGLVQLEANSRAPLLHSDHSNHSADLRSISARNRTAVRRLDVGFMRMPMAPKALR